MDSELKILIQMNTSLGAATIIGVCGIFFLLCSGQSHSVIKPTTYYVLGGGAGSCSGAGWGNAAGKIPSTLNPGDVVYIGNSGVNLADPTTTPCAGEANHIFATSGTSGSHITIKAAIGADHGTSTGWRSSYGVDADPKIMWANSYTAADGLKSGFWSFCPGSYYDINGEVGTADQTGTYGFYFKSAGVIFGFIKADSNDCSQTSITTLNFKNFEIDGVEANTIASDGSNASGIYMGSPVSTGATVTSVSFSHYYVHDILAPWNFINMTGVSLDHGYTDTNFSDSKEHSQGLFGYSAGGIDTNLALNNLTVDDTVWKNIQGTAVIICLTGTCDGWKIYNNIIYYSSDWDSVCNHGGDGSYIVTCGISKTFGDNSAATALTNSVFYGNTMAGLHTDHTVDPSGSDESGVTINGNSSTGNVVENNIWYNCTLADIFYDGSNSHPTLLTHDYNTWLNAGYASFAMELASHELQIGASGQTITRTAADPFVNDAGFDFHLLADMKSAAKSRKATAQGKPLPSPYNIDFDGKTRGADGTWERGAHEFNKAGSGQKSKISHES